MSGIVDVNQPSGPGAEDDPMVRLMDEIAAGAMDGSRSADVDYDYWYGFYRKWFPRRLYPRAQAFLNTGAGERLLPPEYLYGTAVLIRHEPSDVRLIHLLDSERFLYFRTNPRWSQEQRRLYYDDAALQNELWARACLAPRSMIGPELRQICRKYSTYLCKTVEPAQLLSSMEVADALTMLRLRMETEGKTRQSSPASADEIVDFALLDLFDLDYLLQLQSHQQHVRVVLHGLADAVVKDRRRYLLAGPRDRLVLPFVPKWSRRDLVRQVLVFPFASQSLRVGQPGAKDRIGGDDVVFVGFLGAPLDPGERSSIEKINNLRSAANLIIATSLNELRRLLVLEEARHSSVAAIMSRNVSHNIGSHVLHWLVAEEEQTAARKDGAETLDALQRSNKREAVLRAHFLRYVRARMDYVATATRRISWWSSSLQAASLVDPFRKRAHETVNAPEQDHLLMNLVKSDGMDRPAVTCADNAGRNVRVAIPHGWVGRQAFNTILENVIRNSAKHRPRQQGGEKKNRFTVTFGDNPDYPDYIEVQIEDELTSWQRSAKKMIEALSEGVCDPDGRPLLGRLGFKEMRISAAFLRMIDPAKVDELHTPELITLRERSDRVAHVFYIWRAREVLVVTDHRLGLSAAALDAASRVGLNVVEPDERTFDRMTTYRFVLLLGTPDGKVAAWLRSAMSRGRLLPVRLLHSRGLAAARGAVLPDEDVEALKRRITTLAAAAHDEAERLSTAITVDLYDRWLAHHFAGDSKVALAAYPPVGWKGMHGVVPLELKASPDDTDESLKTTWARIEQAVGSQPVGILAHHWLDPETIEAFRLAHPTVRHVEGYSGASAFARFLGEELDADEAVVRLGELRESVLSKILLIDERLAGKLTENVGPEWPGHRDRTLARHRGIWLVGDELTGMIHREQRDTAEFRWAPDITPPFMYAAIHYGIIEKIGEAHFSDRAESTRAVLAALQQISKHVVVFSGRGRPDLPPDVRFVDYTSIEAWFREGKRALVLGLGGL